MNHTVTKLTITMLTELVKEFVNPQTPTCMSFDDFLFEEITQNPFK